MRADSDGAQLLDDVRGFIRRFVAFPSEAALDAVTLWAAMTHVAEHLFTTPRLALLSPEPGSGKSRVLEVLALITHKPMFVFSASHVALFRSIANGVLTLLFDETDTIWARHGKDDSNEDIRALLNMGYRRGATIPRFDMRSGELRHFSVFSPAALAGLGNQPDTITSRSIVIPMRRRLGTERIESFRQRVQEPEAAPLARRLEEWGAQVGKEVGDAWPAMPPGVENRQAELWEPLLAVAERADGHWPDTARASCLEHLKVAEERNVSLGVRLLMDLRTVFGKVIAMSTSDILEALGTLEEAPWANLKGEPLQARVLARMLGQYEVKSTKVKVGGKSLQGHRREDLWDAWERYAPSQTHPVEVEPTEPPESTSTVPGSEELDEPPPSEASRVLALDPPVITPDVESPAAPGSSREVEPERLAPSAVSGEVPEVPDMRRRERSTHNKALI